MAFNGVKSISNTQELGGILEIPCGVTQILTQETSQRIMEPILYIFYNSSLYSS